MGTYTCCSFSFLEFVKIWLTMEGLQSAAEDIIGKSIDFVYQFIPLAEATVVLVPKFVTEGIDALSESTGQDVETLNYVLGMFMCYPLGLIMAMLPYGKTRHIFSFLLGAFLLQFTIGKQWIHQMISSMLAYVMFLILPAKEAKFWVPFMSMVYITLGHLHRQYINYLGWDLDFTGAQMVLTMKLYSMAYNLYDGELIAQGKTDRAAKKCANFAISEIPGIFEFLGYTFCFANVLAGPAYEYKIYENAANGALMYTSDGKPRGKIPSALWPTLQAFLASIFFLGMFVVGNGMLPILDPADPQHNTPVVISEEMLAKPFYYRYAYAWLALFFVRGKYYFAWKNAEGANNIWYAGFEGFDEKGEAKGWENSRNIDVITFETAPNLKTLSAAWNKKTANWLARYVYMRTGGSLVATYGMSAFWHGFYPGYYLFFLSIPLPTACERLAKNKLTPRFSPGRFSAWGIISSLSTSLVIQNMIMTFILLAGDWGFIYLKSQYFFAHILCVVFYIVVSQLPTPKTPEKKA